MPDGARPYVRETTNPYVDRRRWATIEGSLEDSPKHCPKLNHTAGFCIRFEYAQCAPPGGKVAVVGTNYFEHDRQSR